MNKKKYIYILLVGGALFSCAKEPKLTEQSVLISPQTAPTELDNWLFENITKPYNVKVGYRYDDTRTQQSDFVVPASYEKSVEMAKLLKYMFFEPYDAHSPQNFLKKYSPKSILFYGSAAFNPNGTRKLGLAENGVQYSLYEVNNFNKNRKSALFELYLRTMYHEFSHILHQTKQYDVEFKKIAASQYKSDSWNNAWKSDTEALQEGGFMSQYSSKNADEDFVEIISFLMTKTETEINSILERAAGSSSSPKPGRKLLEKKIKIVKDYMKNVWEIDLDALRDDILERAENLKNYDLTSLN